MNININNQITKINEQIKKTNSAIGKTNIAFEPFDLINHLSNKTLNIAFCGQYNAGKSTIIKALTNDESILIGSGVTTDTTTVYQWNNINVIDTPGIGTKLKKDHDEKAYKAINEADMVVYVITNELFNADILLDFRRIAIEHDKAGEMILIVNKMQRHALGNVKEAQEIIKKSLSEALEPYTPDDLYITFIDMESYNRSLKVQNELQKNKLYNRSGYDKLIYNLNRFTEEKHLTGRLTTYLYEMQDKIKEAKISIDYSTGNNAIDGYVELINKNLDTFSDFRKRYIEKLDCVNVDIEQQLIRISDDFVEKIDTIKSKEELDEEQSEIENKIERIYKSMVERIDKETNELFMELNNEIIKTNNSSIARKVKLDLEKNFSSFSPELKKFLKDQINTGANVLKQLDPHLGNSAKLTEYTDTFIYKGVKWLGEKFHFKFKPWQITKISKKITSIFKYAGIVTETLNLMIDIKDYADKDKNNKEASDNRMKIRGIFYSVIDDIHNQIEECKESNLKGINNEIQKLTNELEQLEQINVLNNTIYNELNDIYIENQKLIIELHQN